jgi:hypothetical protein
MSEEHKQPLSIEIRCLAKNLRWLCGEDAQGKRWHLSESEAIAGLENDRWNFHIRLTGRDIPVIIAADVAGRKYLAARVNGKITDDLLSVPDCLPDDAYVPDQQRLPVTAPQAGIPGVRG